MPELSPQAQAVWDAAYNAPRGCSYEEELAAAVEAAADQVVPQEELPMHARGTSYWHRAIQRADTRSKLLAIAAELRGDNTTTETP